MPQQHRVVDLRLSEPRLLISRGEDFNGHVLTLPLAPPHLPIPSFACKREGKRRNEYMQEERKWVFSDQLVVEKVIVVFIFPFRKSLWGTSMTAKGFIHSAAAGALTLICLRRLWSFRLGSTKLHFSNSKLTKCTLWFCGAKQDLRDVTYILSFEHSNSNVAIMTKAKQSKNKKQQTTGVVDVHDPATVSPQIIIWLQKTDRFDAENST